MFDLPDRYLEKVEDGKAGMIFKADLAKALAEKLTDQEWNAIIEKSETFHGYPAPVKLKIYRPDRNVFAGFTPPGQG